MVYPPGYFNVIVVKFLVDLCQGKMVLFRGFNFFEESSTPLTWNSNRIRSCFKESYAVKNESNFSNYG